MELFDRQNKKVDNKQKALLVYLDIYAIDDNGKFEFLELVNSTGVIIFDTLVVKLSNPHSANFIGSGKVEELKKIINNNQLNIVIFSAKLSPSQERNLEHNLKCQVLDRVGLILDIFALRARSFEGKLQVELAQLKHLSTRLIKGWSHLERQKGGIGLRGPGETQLETDRRLIGQRIKKLNFRLQKQGKRRELGRKLRSKNNLPIVVLAGYTNAGKSTLFNILTQAKVYADNRFFATLDTTIRQVILPTSGKIVIADTVGFINDLPQDLVQAFKSTLEESSSANILLHIVDSNDNFLDKIYQVEKILTEIGADKVPRLLVMNKIDLLENFQPRIDFDENNQPIRVWLSSVNNVGIDLLHEALAKKLSGIINKKTIYIKPFAAFVRSQIYDIGYIEKEKIDKLGGWILEIRVSTHYLNKLLTIKGVTLWQNK